MDHRPRKRFGQNFLKSSFVINAILDALYLQPDDTVVEIGPGFGALTKPMLQKLSRLIAIEIDRDLQAYWREYSIDGHLVVEPHSTLGATLDEEAQMNNSLSDLRGSFSCVRGEEKTKAALLELVSADALRVDYSQWGQSIRLVGNLPYNISTPLIFHLLDYVAFIKDMHFMVQKEVAERLAASPGNKNYGRLSIMVQYFCQVTQLFEVEPQAFDPAPKVYSSVIRLNPHSVSPYLPVDRHLLGKVVTQAFAMRRKTLANNLKPWLTAAELMTLNIDPGARPEQIALEDYVRLTHYIDGVSKL